MHRKIEVVTYNPEWQKIFNKEAILIRNILSGNCIAVHHIGSTAVQGLAAKPKIDIIVEVSDCKNIASQLEAAGYTYKGEWNIPFKYGFTKRSENNFNLHLYKAGHHEVELNILFRDYLRANHAVRDEYQQLKYTLLTDESTHHKENNSIFTGYNLGKDAFIRKIIQLIGFDKLRLLYCTHKAEKDAYHRIKVAEIFSRLPNITYDYNHPHLVDANHYHFVLCRGVEVVSIGHMEDLGNGQWGLRGLATNKQHQHKGYGQNLLRQLEIWCRSCGGRIIHTHAAIEAENFYRKLGYIDMPWDDRSISDRTVDLGKSLSL